MVMIRTHRQAHLLYTVVRCTFRTYLTKRS